MLDAVLKYLRISLADWQQAAFERFAEWLGHEAVDLGLLGPHERDRIWGRHMVDSLAFAAAWGQKAPERLLDVGSGAGLPGIPLGILWPGATVTLCERMERRADQLRRVVAILELGNVEVKAADVFRLGGSWPALTLRASLGQEKSLLLAEKVLESRGRAVVGWSSKQELGETVSDQLELRVLFLPADILDPARGLLIMDKL